MSVGITTNLLALRTSILSDTDKESDGAVTSAQVNTWIYEALRDLWARMVPIGRDNFCQTMTMAVGATDVTFTAPNLFTLKPTGAPSTQAALLGIRGVDVDVGGSNFKPV